MIILLLCKVVSQWSNNNIEFDPFYSFPPSATLHNFSKSAFQRTMHTFDDVVWHLSWSVMGDILAVSGGDNKVCLYYISTFRILF